MSRITIPAPQWLDRHRPDTAPFIVAPLDADDNARVLAAFRGQPTLRTAAMRYKRSPTDGDAAVYLLDPDSGTVYVLE